MDLSRRHHFQATALRVGAAAFPPLGPWLAALAQEVVASEQVLQRQLAEVVSQGGEGLMLHHGQARHQGLTDAGLPRFASYWRPRPEE